MTNKEERNAIIRAKRWIHDVIYTHQDVLDGEEPDNTEKAIFEECEVILNALEKQIPKKPRVERGGIHYCYHCGIAIDWENEV